MPSGVQPHLFSPTAALFLRDKDRTLKKRTAMKKYQCPSCPYIYDPAVGDPDNGIPAGTPFEQLPDDWVCPLCGESKEAFVAIEE